MTSDGTSDSRRRAAEAERERKRKLAEIFGEVLPEATSDDRPDSGNQRGDRWYQDNRPPHHGG